MVVSTFSIRTVVGVSLLPLDMCSCLAGLLVPIPTLPVFPILKTSAGLPLFSTTNAISVPVLSVKDAIRETALDVFLFLNKIWLKVLSVSDKFCIASVVPSAACPSVLVPLNTVEPVASSSSKELGLLVPIPTLPPLKYEFPPIDIFALVTPPMSLNPYCCPEPNTLT